MKVEKQEQMSYNKTRERILESTEEYSEKREGTGNSHREEWQGSEENILETPQIRVEMPAKANNICP